MNTNIFVAILLATFYEVISQNQECGNVVKNVSGQISYTKQQMFDPTCCYWIVDISPMAKINIKVSRTGQERHPGRIWVYRVNPENTNTPVERGVWVNGTGIELMGTVFIVSYSDAWTEGNGFVLDFKGSESTNITYSHENHIIMNATTTLSSSTYQFPSNQFTTILIRGPFCGEIIVDITLQYYILNKDCDGKCVLTLTTIWPELETPSENAVRSFYGSSLYPIEIGLGDMTPMVVTIDRRGKGIGNGLHFKLDWNYYGALFP